MVKRIVSFLVRLVLGVFTLIGGIFVILYTIIWDVVREKLFRKKPVESPCFEKVVSKEDMILPKQKSPAAL